MALKKPLNDGTFLYGVIVRIDYPKNNTINFSVSIHRKNQSGEILEIDTTCYFVPDIYPEFFGIDAMNQENNNIFKAGYNWLKQYKPLFADWEDC